MHLSEKITSLEDYLKASWEKGKVTDYVYGDVLSLTTPIALFPLTTNGMIGKMTTVEAVPKSLWWVHRELMRMAVGVYPAPTQALKYLSAREAFQHLLVHVSKEDPSMIAFTASADDGIRDRQTRMQFGRFMRRYYNFAADNAIAAVEAAHRMELNPPVEFIVGEKDPSAFLHAYQSINSCMSKSVGTYGTSMHPVLAYCTPGFQLAILRNASGGISARSLVWVNPENPADKRMVRTYGDTVLHNYLIKNGFEPKAFEPAYLKTQIVNAASPGSDGYANIVCPYIDPGEQARSPEQNTSAVWDGADKLYLLKRGTKLKVPSEYIVSVTNSGGISRAKAFPINRKCAVSGKMINGMTDAFVNVLHDGKQDIALLKEVSTWKAARITYGGASLYCAPETPMFSHGAVNYIEDVVTRTQLGYVQLNPKFYPDDRGWFSKDTTALTKIGLGSRASYIKTEDAAVYIDAGPVVIHMHRDEVPKDADRVAAYNDIKTWANPKVNVVRTIANRKVVPGVHPVVQGYDGGWNYQRHMRQVMIMGMKVWIPSDQSPGSIQLTELPSGTKLQIAAAARDLSVYGNAKKRALFDAFASRGDMLVPLQDASDGKLEIGYIFEYRSIPMKLVEKFLNEPFDESKITAKGRAATPVENMRGFHKHAALVLTYFEEAWAVAHPKEAVPAPAPAVPA